MLIFTLLQMVFFVFGIFFELELRSLLFLSLSSCGVVFLLNFVAYHYYYRLINRLINQFTLVHYTLYVF